MSAQYEFIKSIHNINEDDYQLFTKDFKAKKYKKGDHVVSPGQTENQIYFIKSGVQMYHFDAKDKINILGFSSAPNFCAIPESFFFQKPARYYLTCLEDTELDYLTF